MKNIFNIIKTTVALVCLITIVVNQNTLIRENDNIYTPFYFTDESIETK